MVAVEVAEMETTIQYLRDQVRDLELTNRALETENAIYRARCHEAEEAALNELVRSTQMKQTMSSMSAMLIDGLRKMESDVDAARRSRAEKEARRLEQERALEAETGDKPLFLGESETPPPAAPPPPEEMESSSLDKLPPATFESSEIETDIEKLAKLGEPDDKGSTFR